MWVTILKCCFTFFQGWTRLPDSILQTRCVAYTCHKMPPLFATSCIIYVYIFNKLVVSHLSVVIVVIGHFEAKLLLPDEEPCSLIWLCYVSYFWMFWRILVSSALGSSSLLGPTQCHIHHGAEYQAGHFRCKNLRCCSLLPLQWRWQQAAAKHW